MLGLESSGKNSVRAVREGFLEEVASHKKEVGKGFSEVVTSEHGRVHRAVWSVAVELAMGVELEV